MKRLGIITISGLAIAAVCVLGTGTPSRAPHPVITAAGRPASSCSVVREYGEWYLRLVIPGPANPVRVSVYGPGGHLVMRRTLPYPKVPAGAIATMLYDYAGRYASSAPRTCAVQP